MVDGDAVSDTVGSGITVTVAVAVIDPAAFVAVTV